MSKCFRETLSTFGLGEKLISLRYNANAEDLHYKLIQTYPPLHSCGGYTLLKCLGNSKSLQVIEPPPGGHCPWSLSEVGQSKIYVRPLQRDIEVIPPQRVDAGVS